MVVNMLYLITIFIFTLSSLANKIFLTQITHSESDTVRHLSIITDQSGSLFAFQITEFEEAGPIYSTISFDELTEEIYTLPVPINKFASIDARELSQTQGGKMIVTYTPNIWVPKKQMIEFDLVKDHDTWRLYDTISFRPIIHLKMIINKKAMVPVGIKQFIINPSAL